MIGSEDPIFFLTIALFFCNFLAFYVFIFFDIFRMTKKNRLFFEIHINIRVAGYMIQDTGYTIQDTGYMMQDTGYMIKDTG